MTDKVRIKFARLSNEFSHVEIPAYSTSGSSGMDVRAAIHRPIVINRMEVNLIPTNLSVEIPPGYEIQVRPRSGLAAKNSIGVLNSPGTIDSDYRGEIKIILINFGKENFTLNPGDRIAQLVVSKIYKASLEEVKRLDESKRGIGGFGHTGNS